MKAKAGEVTEQFKFFGITVLKKKAEGKKITQRRGLFGYKDYDEYKVLPSENTNNRIITVVTSSEIPVGDSELLVDLDRTDASIAARLHPNNRNFVIFGNKFFGRRLHLQ